jgi:hypothetical protein
MNEHKRGWTGAPNAQPRLGPGVLMGLLRLISVTSPWPIAAKMPHFPTQAQSGSGLQNTALATSPIRDIREPRLRPNKQHSMAIVAALTINERAQVSEIARLAFQEAKSRPIHVPAPRPSSNAGPHT